MLILDAKVIIFRNRNNVDYIKIFMREHIQVK